MYDAGKALKFVHSQHFRLASKLLCHALNGAVCLFRSVVLLYVSRWNFSLYHNNRSVPVRDRCAYV